MPTRGEQIEARLDALAEQNEWLIKAVKYLLANEAGIEPDEDAWLDDEDIEVEGDASQFEFTAVRTRPQPKKPACPHNRQGLDDDGNVICQRCFQVLTSAGLVHTTLSAKGKVIADPDPPRWAVEHSPGASSKNPGTPLVPHMVD